MRSFTVTLSIFLLALAIILQTTLDFLQFKALHSVKLMVLAIGVWIIAFAAFLVQLRVSQRRRVYG